jgi:hypothetical protein
MLGAFKVEEKMLSDFELIKQLEEEIGISIPPVSINKILERDKRDKYGFKSLSLESGFTMDKNGHVTLLSIGKMRKNSLPLILSNFKHLNIFINFDTILSDISVLKKLPRLTELYLIRSGLIDISILKALKGLSTLHLGNNQIRDISALKELKGLRSLILHNNQIRDISSLKELKRLKRVELSDNDIYLLPAEILDLGLEIKWKGDSWNRECIILEGNDHLAVPPVDIVERGTEAIREYFKSLEGEKRALKEEVPLAGDGNAEKTSQVKEPMEKTINEEKAQLPDQLRQPVEEGARVFISYSHEDEEYRKQLKSHLSALERIGLITNWHDRMITAGSEWEGKIDDNLNQAGVILLLISSSFIDSKYCFDVELKQALQRHKDGESLVIPVIIRPVLCNDLPFAKLQFLPTDRKAVSTWSNIDEAWVNVAEGIKKAVQDFLARKKT